MNRATDTRNSSGKLPSFLGEDADEATTSGARNVGSTDTSGEYEDDYEDTDSDESAGYDDYESDEAYGEQDAGEEEQDEDDQDSGLEPAPRATSRNIRRRQKVPAVRPAGGLGMTFGAFTTIAGLVTAALPAATAAMASVVAPHTVTLLGLAVFAIAAGRRRSSQLQARLMEMEVQGQQTADELRDTLAQLLAGHNGTNSTNSNADSAADMQHVMLSLQRQDQKINNLTKAIKMYGKPLMEIAGQGTELAGSVAQVRSLTEGAAESNRQAINRVEQLVRSSSGKNDLGDLPEQVGKLQVSLAAMSQRLEDNEVRKSLVRVEDATTQLRSHLETLLTGETVKSATAELQTSLTKATAELSNGIKQLQDGNLAGLETSVRDIQRELSGLATGMSQVQAAVKSGARVAQAPQPTAPEATATSQAAKVQSANNPSSSNPGSDNPGSSAAAGTTATAEVETAGYSTGKRKTTGKNVLGAIAKLKQMKG
jgi:hypothetical protein